MQGLPRGRPFCFTPFLEAMIRGAPTEASTVATAVFAVRGSATRAMFPVRPGNLTTGASEARRNAAAGPIALFYPLSPLRNFPLDLPVAGRFI